MYNYILILIGNLDAETLERLDNYDLDMVVSKRNQCLLTKHPSIWSKNFVAQQYSSSSSEVVSAKPSMTFVCKQTTAKIEFSIPKAAEQVEGISDNELASQYTKKESPSSPILTRKRKRTNENISPSQSQARRSIESSLRTEASVNNESEKCNGLASLLDPFAEPIMTKTVSENVTPLRKSNPFVKLKTSSKDVKTSPQTSPISSTFKTLQTFSQLRKFDPNGQEIVTSAYFHAENVTSTEKPKSNILSCGNHVMPINVSEISSQSPKPYAGKKDTYSPLMVIIKKHLLSLLICNIYLLTEFINQYRGICHCHQEDPTQWVSSFRA